MDYKKEIKDIKLRQEGDFDFIMLALRDLRVTFRTELGVISNDLWEIGESVLETGQHLGVIGQRLGAVGQGVKRLSSEVDERLNQVEGRRRLQDQRFSTIIEAAEAWRPEIEAIKARLDRLENRDSAA